jgi:hypothetical protein
MEKHGVLRDGGGHGRISRANQHGLKLVNAIKFIAACSTSRSELGATDQATR